MPEPAGVDEVFAHIELPPCPVCGTTPSTATLNAGRPWDRAPLQPPSARFEPCGHRVTGEAARQFRAGIPWFYKLDGRPDHSGEAGSAPPKEGKDHR